MEPVLQKLAEYGLLGVLLALAIFAIVKLFKLYVETQEKRIVENKEQLEVIKSNTISNDNNTAALRALGELIKAQRG